MRALALLFAAAGVALAAQSASDDPLLRAMRDELERSRTLAITSLDSPYFIEYTVDDARALSVSASLGGLLASSETRFRIPRVRVRVGDYAFDNGNYILSDFYSGTRYDPDQLPVESSYPVLRRSFWLATDRAYKGALEAIARKRAALKNITQSETLPDFWKSAPVRRIESGNRPLPDAKIWQQRVRSLSRAFAAFPQVLVSTVSFDATSSNFYLVNSEGSTLRHPDGLSTLHIRGVGQAADGMTVRDATVVARLDPARLPGDAEMARSVTEVGQNITALAAAPAGESYSGPVIFEGIAAPQLFADVLGTQLSLPRRPVSEPGRPLPWTPSDLEGRTGSRVLPEFLDVVDDPAQKTWKDAPLFGHYTVDEEGVAAQPLTLIEKGKLKAFLLTRQPVRGFDASNGRARIPGAFGAHRAAYGNLFIRASETVKREELKSKLLSMIKERGKPYGMIVRKLDFPSTAGPDELRRLAASAGQGGRVVSPPLLAYRVYPDGREELVRGLRFRGVSVRSLRDISAASDESTALHFLNNLAPLAIAGASSYVAPASVIAPSVLIDDIELERPQDDMPKLPVVPPPPLTSK